MIPKIIYPSFTITLKSSEKTYNFRRYIVREEKILLMAKESKEANGEPNVNEIFKAIKDVVAVCCLDEEFNVDEIPLFELEYIFLKLRAASVNNIEPFTVTDTEDGRKYNLNMDFDAVDIKFNEDAPSKNIKVNDSITLVMRYPKASIFDDTNFKDRLKKEGIYELAVSCVDQVYVDDELQILNNDELKEFIDNLDIKTYRKIEEFLITIPSIYHEITYRNSVIDPETSEPHVRKIAFKSLIDFFLYL